jgi:hypothetical protein
VPGRDQGIGGSLGRPLVDVDEDDARARGGQGLGHRTADPLRGAGDDGGLAGQDCCSELRHQGPPGS